MTTFKRLLMVFLVFLLASCATPPATPDVKVKGYAPVSGKLPLKVALIISEHLKLLAIETTVTARCLRQGGRPSPGSSYYDAIRCYVTTDKMYAENNIGVGIESLFVQGLPYLFDDVVVGYRDITSIKNIKDFDLILYPDIEIETSYDKEGALKREISDKLLDISSLLTGKWKKGLFQIFVEGKLKLKVVDVKSGLIYNFVEDFKGIGWAYSKFCSRKRFDNTKDYVLSMDYNRLIELVLTKSLPGLLQKVETGLLPLAKARSEERALPSDLALNVRFSDTSGFLPNNSIDAGEDAEAIVTIKNTGRGAGYGTNLEVSTDNSKITFDRNINVGDIQPNETKEIKIPLKAGLDIGDGKAAFQFNLKEKRGYDAKKVAMYVPTAKLERPQLEIVSTEINDGDTGLAKGNGNGIIESGETIELAVFIKNQGIGKAIGVNLNTAETISGIQWVRDSAFVGTISRGEIVKAKVAFTVPRNFDAKEIATNLKVSDSRGVNNAEKRAVFAFAKRSPNISYAYRIHSKGNQVNSITNGETYELELTLNNSGQIPARNVAVNLTSYGGLNLSNSRIEIGDLKEQASAPKQTINISVPRTYIEKQAQLSLEISQSDFPSVKDSIQIPVVVKVPKLRYVTNLLSKDGGNILEQGEGAVLEIYVLNEGSLSADGVRLKIESRDENLKIVGRDETLIGKIPPNSRSGTEKFQISTLRRIKVGDAYLGVHITQGDFSPVASQYAINIREEGVSIVDIAKEGRSKEQAIAKTESGPAIDLKTPRNVETTEDESIRLAFEVTDSRNIENIKVTVNESVIINERPVSKRKEILKDIPLMEGTNRIVITAYNVDNMPAKKEIIITRIAEDVESPRITGLNNPAAIGVVIGISRYEKRDIPSVDYARRDAETIKRYLINTLGLRESNIEEFYDEKATATKLRSYFGTYLKNKVRPGISDVYIFYSGHGVPEGNEAYFAPYDLDQNDVKITGYAIKELYKQLKDIKAKSITVVIDACFSGKSEGDVPVIKSASPVYFEISNPLLETKNGVVFTSSTGKQISSWYHKKQHGLFTYYFLLGLRGRADMNNDGQITADEMERYLSENVSKQAMSLYNRVQTPEVVGNKDIVLVRF